MKKLIALAILIASIALTGCGDSNDDFVFVQQQGQGVVQGFFVSAATGNDATGSFATGAPFATIQAAVAAAGAGQTITVLPGNYTGAVTLADNQMLTGQAGQARPVLDSTLTLANGNTINRIRIQGVAGDGILGNNVNGATITNNEIVNLTGLGIAIRDTRATGNWAINGNTLTGNSIGVTLNSDTGDNLVARIENNNIANNRLGSVSFIYSGASQVRALISSNTMTGTVTPGRTFEVTSAGTGNGCFDIIGNTNADTYSFGTLVVTTTMNVEQLAQLAAINMGGAGASTPAGSMPATDVANGTCGF